ncbi:nucleotidyltransferase domain-containing protein [Mucilaginibacter sp. McL0603]|uniref:nucleotidyltransferase domain-containing protein n=1 Tax=Mucilaginibacter sp. McL0603 TaxID=3415670 RepID=UPI003CEE27EA
MSDIKKNILAALAYFDLFNYPLTMDEVFLNLPIKCEQQELEFALSCLVSDRVIYHFGKFYTLKNDYFLIERRLNGNAKAEEMIGIAKQVGDFLVRFPYVRGIAISGSLSKNFADESSDIDLFIITAKNRLWLARTIMHCFKKLTFLVNKHQYFCMNYYIDEKELQIREKNIYTAIEIATLMPLHGDTVFEQFYIANAWTREYLPNKCLRLTTAEPLKKTWLKSFTEMLFNNWLGNKIDNLLLKISAKRWLKNVELKKLNDKGIIMGMDCGKHHSKPDPRFFQEKLIGKYQSKISQLLDHLESSVAH